MNKLLFITKNVHYHENLNTVFNISVLYPKRYNMLKKNAFYMHIRITC